MVINPSQARRGLLNPSTMLRTLCHNRIMLWQFIKRSIQLQHKGSAFGIGWMVLSPLLLFGVYVLVFMFVFKGKYGAIPNETPLDFAIGLFLSLTLIQLIQETMAGAPLSILQNSNYVKKVVFPLEILPVVNFGAAFLRCLVALSLVLIAAVVSGPGLTPLVCWLPVLVLMFSLFSMGVAWILAALGVFIRDLAPFMQFLTQILAFVSGVFYSHNNLPAEFSFLRFNPIMVVIELSRDVVLWHVAPDVGSLVYLGVVSCLTCVVGYALFSALKPAFADVV
jgi:lipopolysaccharide transport system permease protein